MRDNEFTMKTAVSFLLVAGASAFAPATTSSSNAALKAAADFDGMIGMDVESGKKFVSETNRVSCGSIASKNGANHYFFNFLVTV
jgi:hypothetical protein